MSRLTLVEQNSQQAKLLGDLTLNSVPQVVELGQQLIKQAQHQWVLDMTAVEQVSSVGVALLLQWLRQCRQQQVQFVIVGLPQAMRPILRISDLEPIFLPLLRPSH
ncbi:MAG: STAS domain-containing protein [Venatoribacter sp.]